MIRSMEMRIFLFLRMLLVASGDIECAARLLPRRGRFYTLFVADPSTHHFMKNYWIHALCPFYYLFTIIHSLVLLEAIGWDYRHTRTHTWRRWSWTQSNNCVYLHRQNESMVAANEDIKISMVNRKTLRWQSSAARTISFSFIGKEFFRDDDKAHLCTLAFIKPYFVFICHIRFVFAFDVQWTTTLLHSYEGPLFVTQAKTKEDVIHRRSWCGLVLLTIK